MNIGHTGIGLAVGVLLGAMDFSLAKSISALVHPSNGRLTMAIMMSGFIFRIGVIGFLLWTLYRANNISFMAVCVGLLAAFTVLTLRHAVRAFTGNVRMQKHISDRR